MSTSPKGIRATDQRVNFLTKAKQARYDKKMKMSASKGPLNTMKNDFKVWAANGNINSGTELAQNRGGLIDANM